MNENSVGDRFPGYKEETMLLDWVNSLDILSCSLVNKIPDFRSGVVCADILSYLKKIPFKSLKRHKVSLKDSLSNWDIILGTIQEELPQGLKLSPQDMIENLDNLKNFLKWLYEEDFKNTESKRSYGKLMKSPGKRFKGLQESNSPHKKGCSTESKHFISPKIKSLFATADPRPEFEITQSTNLNRSDTFKVQKTSDQITDWIKELRVIKSFEAESITELCKSGVILGDIINRVSGRKQPITGIERQPKNTTQAFSNINKALKFLRQNGKIKGRYLFSARDILAGDEEVIWGLLGDIKEFYAKFASRSSTPNRSFRSYSNTNHKTRTPMEFLKPSTPSKSSSTKFRAHSTLRVAEAAKVQAENWVTHIGLKVEDNENNLRDNVKNGALLCKVLEIWESESLSFNERPRNSVEVRENFEKALELMRKKKIKVPNEKISNVQELCCDSQLVWALLYVLMRKYTKTDKPQTRKLDSQFLTWLNKKPKESLLQNPESEIKLFTNKNYSFYNYRNKSSDVRPTKTLNNFFKNDKKPSRFGLNRIDLNSSGSDIFGFQKNNNKKTDSEQLLKWLDRTGIKYPGTLDLDNSVLPEFSSGLLLSQIIFKFEKEKLPGIDPDPKSQAACLKNIRIALKFLRSKPTIPQYLIESSQKIYEGDSKTIKELLKHLAKIYQNRLQVAKKISKKSHSRQFSSFV